MDSQVIVTEADSLIVPPPVINGVLGGTDENSCSCGVITSGGMCIEEVMLNLIPALTSISISHGSVVDCSKKQITLCGSTCVNGKALCTYEA